MNSDIIFISTPEDLQSLKKYQKIKYVCTSCGAEVTRLYLKSRFPLISRLQCKKCNYKQTCLETYGCENIMHITEFKDKLQKTNLEKYGNVCSLNGAEQIRKKKETWIKNFGKDNPYQKEEVKEKVKRNNLEKYGREYSIGTPENIRKSMESKIKNGNIGVPKVRYRLDGIKFDSSWEVAFYIWNRDNNKGKIERNAISFDYELDGKHHKTFVDFKIDDRLYEVKNPYLLNRDAVSIKRCEVMKENNVIFITDPKIYLDFVKERYGNHYIESLRI